MRKIQINRKNYLRAILTDTLPYEIPLFHTNEPLFSELTRNPDLRGFPSFASGFLLQYGETRPFIYQVQKGSGALRGLAVPHPAAQIKFSELYRDFDSYIENICSRSPYSLRYPTRVGSHFFHGQYGILESKVDGVEQDPASFDSQRQWASSYFYYKKYSHIHKFFSSEEFIRFEQNFSLMLKLDISRCFESIYTHSISWAIRGKEFGKNNRDSFFFESEFDKKMRNSNWGETSGILIGPEISRIFAESIMQSIDVEVHHHLEAKSIRVAIRRYVDDFFIFGNSHDDLLLVKSLIESAAAKYNLHLNEKKTEMSPRPFTSSMAVARQRVVELLKATFRAARKSLLVGGAKGHFSRGAADKVIAEIRRIARGNDVDYAPLVSPALAAISREIQQIRRRLGREVSEDLSQMLDRVIAATLKLAAFLFLMDIRSSTSHKIAKILFECSLVCKKVAFGRTVFEGRVMDIVRVSLEQARARNIKGPEIINVLVAADALCISTRGVTEDHLRSAFGIDGKWQETVGRLNYFELVSMLYFSRKLRRFDVMRRAACDEIRRRIIDVGSNLKSYAEETMLFFDFLSCPYIEESERFKFYEEVAKVHGSTCSGSTHKQQFTKMSRAVFFVAWKGAAHFQAMLQRKELQPAYD